jgi:hypothetical protein
MARARELDPATYHKIQALCALGDTLAADNAFGQAIVEYNKAWAMVPEPKQTWEASTWILAALADAAYHSGDGAMARDALQFAMRCPGAIGNPFLHLRYGEVLFDAGELTAAADELMRAYMAEGPEIFAAENPRYLAFLKTRAKI